MEPRVAQLLGLEEGAASDRQDLFAAWRLFFERLADSDPVVLAFEDLQWADSSARFRRVPARVVARLSDLCVTLARPELQERRPSWGAGQRNFGALYLEPLAQAAMEALLDGLVPGLPEELRGQILAARRGCRCMRSRRCGCCLTAACSRRKARSTGQPARSRRWRCRRRCRR